MSETRNIFAKNLARLIEQRGIDQQTLAFALNVSTSIVSAWVLGRRFPRADKMQQLADYFHVTVSDLVEDNQGQANREVNPKLAILHSRSKALTDKQLDIVNSIIDEMVKERDDFSE